MAIILTSELTKVYKTQLGKKPTRSLDALNLSVGENDVFGFLGRNGAGKTTTIKLLCSLLRPTKGSAEIFGEPIRSRKARALVGYLPENPYFYEYLTAKETIDFYGQLQGLPARARTKEWERLAELFELGPIADQRVRGFSKGMRQRLGFAVALVGDPPLLILDEPMSGLDPLGRRSIRELILRLRDAKKTLFFSSHVLSDVELICNQVAILVKGKLTKQGRIDELLTERVLQVELVVSGISDALREFLAAKSASHRVSEAGHHFIAGDIDEANVLIKAVHSGGGSLIECTPVRESLEDYFMREQGSLAAGGTIT
jgi:ABC-2 type transport system ATP-binding protein